MLYILFYVCAYLVHFPGRTYSYSEIDDFLRFALPSLSASEVQYARDVIWFESRGDSSNRTGSHFGLFQQAERVHGRASVYPVEQARWAWNDYVASRYGSFRKAREFQKVHRWY